MAEMTAAEALSTLVSLHIVGPYDLSGVIEVIEQQAQEIERSRWISVKDKLPEPPLYDWVLVQAKMVPEGWYGVPHIAELRHGVWYGDCYDEPLENCCSIEITHWMPLPEHPIVRNIKEAEVKP